jgi:hypothetical protein
MALNGRINQLPVLDVLSNWFSLPSLQNLPYRDLSTHFAVDQGRMQMRDMALHTSDADLGVAGSIGLDGGLDLGLQVKLSEALSKRYMNGKSMGALTSLFSDPSGRLVFDFKVGGNYRSPKLQPDLQKTAGTAGVSALTASVVQRILGKLPLGGSTSPGEGTSPPVPPGGATEEAANRAVEEAKKQLEDKLGGLFGGAKKKTTPPDTAKSSADTTRGR